MEIYKLQEFFVLLVCSFSGVIIGVFYDFLRAFKRQLPKKAHPFFDLVFWLGASLTFYLAIYFSNNAKLRWYEFFFLALGVYLYFMFLTKYVFRVFLKGAILIFSFFRMAKKIFSKFISFFKRLFCPYFDFWFKTRSKISYNVHKKTFEMRNKIKKSWKNISEKN